MNNSDQDIKYFFDSATRSIEPGLEPMFQVHYGDQVQSFQGLFPSI